MSMPNRSLTLAGVHNFRDLGGYAAGGARLRTNLMFRSGHHFGATPADLETIDSFRLKTIIDLRSPGERLNFPCRRVANFDGTVLHLSDQPPTAPTANAPHLDAALRLGGADNARAAMQASYDRMPFRPELLLMLRRYITALASSDEPSLIHCYAGKDRTGLLVAVLHRALGVHADDIMADYLLSNTAGDPEARIADGASGIRQMIGGAIDDDAIRVIMSVEPAYLEAAIRTIDAVPGGFEGYMETVVGIDPDLRTRLQERLLES